MPPPLEPPIGGRFGRLTVLGLSRERPRGERAWDCRCACDGRIIAVPVRGLLHSGTISCGCIAAEKHRNALARAARRLPAARACAICQRTFRPACGTALFCSADCRRENNRRWALARRQARAVPRGERPCVVCGRSFVADRKNGVVCGDPACRAQHKRDMANSLNQGRLPSGTVGQTCVICATPFRGHPNSLVCSAECRRARNRELAHRRLGIESPRCIICGVGLPRNQYTCGPVCRRVAKIRRNRRGYERHPERRETMVAAHRRRMDTDPDYRERVRARDRRYQAHRAATRLLRETLSLGAALSERMERTNGSDSFSNS